MFGRHSMPKEVVDLASERGHVHWPISGVHTLMDKTEKLRLCDRYAEALALQPEEISRYLRESKFIKPFAIEFLAAMLDPTADTAWKLAFSRRRRGKPSPSKNE